MNHLDLSEQTFSKWQHLVDLMAEMFAVPGGFIVRYTRTGYEVLVAGSNPENPYKMGGFIDKDVNIFCKKVVNECKELIVFDASLRKEWQTNPEVMDDGFNTYVGYPLLNPDQTVFGTICILDYSQKPIEASYFKLIEHLKSVIELDLVILDRLDCATELSLTDDLTGLHNRRGFNVLSQQQYHIGKRLEKRYRGDHH